MQNNTSIYSRIFRSFSLIILLIVIIFQVFIILGLRQMVYNNLEKIMETNLDNITYRISSTEDTSDIVDLISTYDKTNLQNSNSQIQFITKNRNVVYDSIGVLYNNPVSYPDIDRAISGQMGTWMGKVDYTKQRVIAISKPIYDLNNNNLGVLRMISSTSHLDRFIIEIISFTVLISLIVITSTLFISNYFSKSIVKPLKSLSDVAVKIADGQTDVRSDIDADLEIMQLSRSINYMADELIKKDELKNDFISSVSHELRTPLTSIKGWAMTVQSIKESDDELVNEGLNIIVNESDRLSEMVEELLDVSRYDSGRVTLKKENVDVKSYLLEIILETEGRILNADEIFCVDLADNLGKISIDRKRMKQVFINIFDNAIKFTDKGGAIILTTRRNSMDELIISIADTGAGIQKDDIKRVKEKFYKGNLGQSHTGLGLSIADEIVMLHNGKLEVESEVDKGTRMTIILPGKKDEQDE